MSDDALTPEELARIRSIMGGISAAEWRALKVLASAVVGTSGGGGATHGRPVASDGELDSQYGNPVVRKDPKRWAGASYVTATYSQCPSDYLAVLADFLDFKADKDAEKPEPPKHRNGKFYYEFNRKDAALARGWAARNRGLDKPPPARETEAVEAASDEEFVP